MLRYFRNEEWWAFFAVKHKNNRNPSEEGDIAIMATYSHTRRSDMKTADITQESLLYKVFDGVIDTEGEKVQPFVELSLEKEQTYRFRHNKSFSERDPHRLSEFQHELYEDLFYLRITEIKFQEQDEKPIVVPQTALCFYHEKLPAQQTALVQEN